MKYTFEITIAGCAVSCAHCYVNGGPDKPIKLSDFMLAANKMFSVFHRMEEDIDLTLGNELFCNPDIAEILSFCNINGRGYFSYESYPVPTTGIALVNHKDREKSLWALRMAGAKGFMLAVHGGREQHNQIVQNTSAYDGLFQAVELLHFRGFEILFNLMVSKALAAGFDEVMDKINQYPGAKARLTVPLYVPTPRMRNYQALRADVNDCIQICHKAEKFGMDTSALVQHLQNHCEKAVIERVIQNGFDFPAHFSQSPEWAFFHIAQNLDFYYGNVGAHAEYLGNLCEMDEKEIYRSIAEKPANYNYTTMYSKPIWDTLEQKIAGLPERASNLVYPSIEDCLYALLDELGVQNLLI